MITMSTPEIKRLAKSHVDLLNDTVDALRAQGADLKLSNAGGDCVFITGAIGSEDINDGFYLDNEQSIDRLRTFNQHLRSFIKTQLAPESTSACV
jgi:hypothetical protein